MNHKTPFQVADAVIQLDFEYLTIHIAAVMENAGRGVRIIVSPGHTKRRRLNGVDKCKEGTSKTRGVAEAFGN